MNRLLPIVLLLIGSVARAACTSQLQVQPSGHIAIDFCAPLTVAQGDGFTITIDGVAIPVVAETVVDLEDVIKVETDVVNPASPEVVLLGQGGNEKVTASVGSQTVTLTVKARSTNFQNYRKYTWSVGPATKGNKDGSSSTSTAATTTTTDNASPGAIRLQYNASFAKGRPLSDKSTIPLQTIGTLEIDTTDQHDPGFIDNNRGTFGLQIARLGLGNFLKQGRIGVEARASKAFHADVHDLDGALTLAGWLPVIPSLNILNREGNFLAPPLSFSASYGYRNRDQSGDRFHGRVFEGKALYHVFAGDRFNLDFAGTWTINDMYNRPTTTPKTQRLYKATISYLENPNRGFTVLTTIEDGSAGVMLTKVRQYFIGLALSKINFSGSK